MDEQTVRRAYNYQLKPTPEQARQREGVWWCCRTLSSTALAERITASRRCGVTRTQYQQMAELPDLKAAFPEHAAIHSQVVQDVVTRLDTTAQAFFQRVQTGTGTGTGQTPGSPRLQGRTR